MTNQHESSKVQRRRRFTPMRVGAFVAAGAIVLAACGGAAGGKSASGNGMAAMAAPRNATGNTKASAPVATNAVSITNFAFSPAAITVTVDSTVVWTNNDSVQHDITFDSGSIASSVLNQNDTFSHTFPTAGTYHYICSIHPFMHGTVIVTG